MPEGDFRPYLSEVCRLEPLSPEDNLAYALATRYGHAHVRRAARKALVLHNMRLVAAIANRYRNRGVPYEDLCEYGVAGLLEAIDKFDWQRDVRFVTYAHVAVEHTIQRDMHQTRQMIRVPAHHQQTEWLFNRTKAELAAALGCEPSDKQVLDRAGIDPEVHARLATARYSVSLDEDLALDGGCPDSSCTLQDLIADEQMDIEMRADVADLWNAVLECIDGTAAIDARIPAIFRQYYLEGRTFRDIGPRMGISHERARQLRNLGMTEIKRQLEGSDLGDIWQAHDCRLRNVTPVLVPAVR